jgi:hypothetical protein
VEDSPQVSKVALTDGEVTSEWDTEGEPEWNMEWGMLNVEMETVEMEWNYYSVVERMGMEEKTEGTEEKEGMEGNMEETETKMEVEALYQNCHNTHQMDGRMILYIL